MWCQRIAQDFFRCHATILEVISLPCFLLLLWVISYSILTLSIFAMPISENFQAPLYSLGIFYAAVIFALAERCVKTWINLIRSFFKIKPEVSIFEVPRKMINLEFEVWHKSPKNLLSTCTSLFYFLGGADLNLKQYEGKIENIMIETNLWSGI